jgi:hypothetical protein
VRLLEQLIKVRFFVLATVAIFAATFVAGSVLRQRLLADLTLALEPVLLLGWTWSWHAYRKGMLASFGQFEETSVPSSEDAMPERLAAMRGDLRSLGFRFVGQLRSRFPWQDWRTAWVFFDRNGIVAAQVAFDLKLDFATYWPDGSLVVTSSGVRSVRVDLPMLRQRSVAGRPAEAYRRHLAECEAFAEVHGETVALDAIADVAERDALARQFRRDAFAAVTTGRGTVFTEAAVCVLAVVLLVFELAALI